MKGREGGRAGNEGEGTQGMDREQERATERAGGEKARLEGTALS